MSDRTSKLKSAKATDRSPADKYQRWKEEIIKAEKELEQFHTSGQQVVRRFIDERDGANNTERKFNIFSTNVVILQSSLYAKIPKVSVERRFNQSMDDAARFASMMLQNVIMQDMDEDECNFGQVMRDAVEDRLVPGIGAAWVRLRTETEEQELEEQWDPVTGEMIQEAATYEEISEQEVEIDHVHWADFLYSPCRTWSERRWVGRRVYMDKDALTERFGEAKAAKIPLDYTPDNADKGTRNSPINEVFQKAIIYEIWDRVEKRVLWLSKGYPELLDEKEDPLKLENFDPCPKPLFALTSTSNCVPRADFVMIQDQYNELDLVNNRIALLVQACKVVGVYDASATGIQRMLNQGTENTMIPVDNWAIFGEKGGVKGTVDWLPLETVIAAMERLRQAREDIKGQIYELTGISDIVRGDTKASETLGAQKIKAGFASVRIQKLQDEVARFAQDILRIKAEIICKHFVPEQIIALSNAQYYPDFQNQQLVMEAIALLKNEDQYEWRVNVQADSLGQVDYASQKQEKVEFTNAIATFLQSAATTMKAVPDSAPIIFETLKFAVSGFKGGQELEGVIDAGLQQIMQKIQNPPPPPPDPAVEKAKAEMAMEQQRFQMDSQAKQQELQMEQQKMAMDQQAKQQELAFKQQEHEMDMAFKLQEQQLNMQMQREKFDTQIAQDSAKAMQQMEINARKDKESANGS